MSGAGELTALSFLQQYPSDISCNGISMFSIFNHSLSASGFLAQACACVVVAKKSKKQSLI